MDRLPCGDKSHVSLWERNEVADGASHYLEVEIDFASSVEPCFQVDFFPAQEIFCDSKAVRVPQKDS